MELGDQFAGYRIESLVGRGGMGVVYRATQLDLGRTVALKVIAPEALQDEAARARFVSEARHAAAIEHPHVVPIHAAGEADGTAYFVMRFIHGDDLRTRVRRDGPLAPPAAAEILHCAAAALDAIHRAGLVHRDVKPANILLADGDHAYLTDFGLARVALARESSTGSGRWAGSLHYAAPEQIRGGRVDARADIYALGGVLVFMLTGHVPFDRDTDEATLWAHISEPPPRPSALRRGLPKAFDEVVARAMAKVPEDRYASAGDLGRDAVAAAHGRRAPRRRGPVAQGAASAAGAPAVPGLTDEAPTLGSAARVPGRVAPPRRRLLPAVPAGVVLALALVAFLALRDRGRPAPRGSAAVQKTPTPPPATATPTVPGPHVAGTFRHVSDRPNSVALVGGRLWITSRYVPLLRMDAQTGGRRERDESVPPGGIAISRHGNRVWVSNRHRHFVVEIHARSHRVLLRLPQPGPPAAIAADDSGGVWVAIRGPLNEPPDTLIHYDATGRTLWQKDVRQGITALVLSPRALWVALTKVPRLMTVDRRTGRTRTVPVINQAGFLTYGGGYVWASAPFDGSVTRVEPRTGRAASAAAGQHPAQLAYTAGRLFVACVNDRTLAVIDPRSLRRVKQIPMPLNPYGVTADSRHVWVTSLGEDTVTRVDVD